MKDNVIQVRLWDKLVGILSWEECQNRSTFVFDKDFIKSGLNIAPFVAPLNSIAMQRGFPIIGNKDKPYSGLPEFIADSLPDSWGNVVFQYAERTGVDNVWANKIEEVLCDNYLRNQSKLSHKI